MTGPYRTDALEHAIPMRSLPDLPETDAGRHPLVYSAILVSCAVLSLATAVAGCVLMSRALDNLVAP